MIDPEDVSCLILAGGAGTRAGGKDKGLILWRNQPLITHVANTMAKQTGRLLVSCNRNIEAYQNLGFRTVVDTHEAYQGPLAGIEAASGNFDTPYLAVVACDMPLIPNNLVKKLLQPFTQTQQHNTRLSFAHDGNREQYLCAILDRECLQDLPDYMRSGQRAVKHWYKRHAHTMVDFSEQTASFRNFNDFDSFSIDQ
ncbi:UNVERIFIED_CONTAM: hypothetical protein GTU68_034875 [Idotea baltica]|nr:hypothetical protein [Idotea baltica]